MYADRKEINHITIHIEGVSANRLRLKEILIWKDEGKN